MAHFLFNFEFKLGKLQACLFVFYYFIENEKRLNVWYFRLKNIAPSAWHSLKGQVHGTLSKPEIQIKNIPHETTTCKQDTPIKYTKRRHSILYEGLFFYGIHLLYINKYSASKKKQYTKTKDCFEQTTCMSYMFIKVSHCICAQIWHILYGFQYAIFKNTVGQRSMHGFMPSMYRLKAD